MTSRREAPTKNCSFISLILVSFLDEFCAALLLLEYTQVLFKTLDKQQTETTLFEPKVYQTSFRFEVLKTFPSSKAQHTLTHRTEPVEKSIRRVGTQTLVNQQ